MPRTRLVGTWLDLALLLIALPAGASGQASEKEAVLSAIVRTVRAEHQGGRVVLDLRMAGPLESHSVKGDGKHERALMDRVARGVGAQVESGEVSFCHPEDGDCQASDARLYLMLGEPLITSDTAVINVIVKAALEQSGRHPPPRYYRESSLFTLERRGNSWHVVSKELRVIS